MDPKADITERRLQLDRSGHSQRAEHDHARHDVRQDVTHEYPPAAHTTRARGQDEVAFAQRHCLRVHDTTKVSTKADPDDDADRTNAGLRNRKYRCRQQQDREAEDDVRSAHQQLIDEAPEHAGNTADQEADQRPHQR